MVKYLVKSELETIWKEVVVWANIFLKVLKKPTKASHVFYSKFD
jgi:hypothetical protein